MGVGLQQARRLQLFHVTWTEVVSPGYIDFFKKEKTNSQFCGLSELFQSESGGEMEKKEEAIIIVIVIIIFDTDH